MLKNKNIYPQLLVPNSYHKYVIDYCLINPKLLKCPQDDYALIKLEDINVPSLYLSGYIDRLQYAEYPNLPHYLSSVNSVILAIDDYILALKSLINEISSQQIISATNRLRLSAFDELCNINKDLKAYVELQENSSNREDYSKLVAAGSGFLLNLYQVKYILTSAGLETNTYIDSFKELMEFINDTVDDLKNRIAYNFSETFNNKNYSSLISLCLGVDFLKYVENFIYYEIINTPEEPTDSIFKCNIKSLYSLGENFNFRYFDLDLVKKFSPDEDSDFLFDKDSPF